MTTGELTRFYRDSKARLFSIRKENLLLKAEIKTLLRIKIRTSDNSVELIEKVKEIITRHS